MPGAPRASAILHSDPMGYARLITLTHWGEGHCPEWRQLEQGSRGPSRGGHRPVSGWSGGGLGRPAEGPELAVGEHTGSGWVGKACRGWEGFLDFDPLSKHAEGLLKQIPGPGSGALTPQVPGGAWPVPVSQVPSDDAAAGVETTL